MDIIRETTTTTSNEVSVIYLYYSSFGAHLSRQRNTSACIPNIVTRSWLVVFSMSPLQFEDNNDKVNYTFANL